MPSPQSLVASYRRFPTETDSHRASIQFDGERLTWHNAAGQVWSLRLEDTTLYIDESCPHYAEGLRSMEIQMEGDEVVGIEFMGLVYAPQMDIQSIVVSMPNIQERIEGRYERHPMENANHMIKIDYDDGVLRWENNDGVSWVLSVSEGDENVLNVGEDCPFYAEGGTKAVVQLENDNVTGIEFMGEVYTKTDVFGEDESEGAVCIDGPEDVYGPEDASTDGL